MAAKKIKPAKENQKKGVLRGKMPTKRSINLVLVNENKINPLMALLGILLVLALAAAFSKFLVIDRMSAMSKAQSRVSRIQGELDSTLDKLENIGDLGETYAHYTLEGMTSAELGLVDRIAVLSLVDSILPKVDEGPSEEERAEIISNLFRPSPVTGNEALDKSRQAARDKILDQLVPIPEYVINKWNLTDNLLTLEVNGQSLERLNLLGQQIESSPIVNTCTIVTANKAEKREVQEDVYARYIIYLQQPPEGYAAEAAADAAGEDSQGGKGLNFGAITQFIGGEASAQ